jgi:hypothetical protein
VSVSAVPDPDSAVDPTPVDVESIGEVRPVATHLEQSY